MTEVLVPAQCESPFMSETQLLARRASRKKKAPAPYVRGSDRSFSLRATAAEFIAKMPTPGETFDDAWVKSVFAHSKRRMYDVTNVMAGVGMLERMTKGRYRWLGPGGFVAIMSQLREWGYETNADRNMHKLIATRHKKGGGTARMSVLQAATYCTVCVLDLGHLRNRPYMQEGGTQWERTDCAQVVLDALELCAPEWEKSSRIAYDVMNVLEAVGLVSRDPITNAYTLRTGEYYAKHLGSFAKLLSASTGRQVEIITVTEDGAEEVWEIDPTQSESREVCGLRRKRPAMEAEVEVAEKVADPWVENDREALTLSSPPKIPRIAPDPLFPELADDPLQYVPLDDGW